MSTQTHLAALELRHQALEQEICEGHTHLSCDDLKINELKRRRLLVKDEIACLQRGVTPPSSISELQPEVKPKTANRAVRLQSSSWYAGAARSIAIRKPKRF